jgi:hypothetical protein
MNKPAALSVVIILAASAHAQVNNPPNLYGHLNQRGVQDPAGLINGFGMWACGPTSVVNSFGYLENRFPAYYNRMLVPEVDGQAGVTWADLESVARQLANPNFMDTKAPANNPPGSSYDNDNYYPDIHGIGPGQNAGTTGGGTTFANFAWGKDAYLRQPNIPATPITGIMRDPYVNVAGRNKPAWLMDNQQIPASFLFNAINQGKDLEIGFTWQNGTLANPNDSQGGHFVTVFGYRFNPITDDLNNNGVLDPGEAAQLNIIDPFGPTPVLGDYNNAPELSGLLTTNAAGELFFSYAGGAAGFNGAFGRIRIGITEIPSPSAGAGLLIGLAITTRRRRPRA